MDKETDDQILQRAADEAEAHEIVGRCYRDLNRGGRHMDAAELLIKHIMQPHTHKDLGKGV